jgi:hypothetical protein
MTSRADEQPDFERDIPLTAEAIEALRDARLNPPHLTWDEYVRAVDEFNRQWPPNREIKDYGERFEI